jgi:hypothetical protein
MTAAMTTQTCARQRLVGGFGGGEYTSKHQHNTRAGGLNNRAKFVRHCKTSYVRGFVLVFFDIHNLASTSKLHVTHSLTDKMILENLQDMD